MEKGRIETSIGQIIISKDVIAQYAGCVAMTTTGIVGMAMISMRDGVYKLLKKESLRKGVDVSIEDNEISIDFHVIVAYGINVKTIADNVISNVCYEVEQFTGMKVKEINLYIDGVKMID